MSGGHVAALNRDELYEVQAGRAGVSRLQAFGVIFGDQRVVIYIEPKNGTENHVIANTARTTLFLNDEPLPWLEWAAEFRASMPDAIKALVEEVSAKSSEHDHQQSIRERLKQILDLFKVSRYKPVASGAITIEDSVLGLGGVAVEKDRPRSGSHGKPGGTGGRAGDIYALFQTVSGNPGEEVKTFAPEPKVQWISVNDGTRTPPDLEDRAAKYLPPQNTLMINADFRVFNDMVDRWCKKYSHVSGAKSVVESVVREWFEQQLVETIMGALALRGSSQWTMEDLEKLWGDEALTAAVLPRYHVDINVKRTLGSKIGSLKEQVA